MLLLRWIIPFVVLLASLRPAAAYDPFPEGCKLIRYAGLPFKMAHGHMSVAVTVNGRPAEFIVDTGGYVSAISSEAVKRLGLETHGIHGNILLGDLGDKYAERYAGIDSLVIGNTHAPPVSLMVAGSLDADGILAPDMLSNFDVDIDFADGTINLFRPHPCEDHVVYWTKDYEKLPFALSSQRHIKLNAILDGRPLAVIFDTGSPLSLISADAVPAGLPGAAIVLTGASGGKVNATGRQFDTFALGQIIWPHPTLFVTDSDTSWRSEFAEMLLGIDQFHDSHLYIDYRNKVLYLSK
jgi:predicted aspartyl protease